METQEPAEGAHAISENFRALQQELEKVMVGQLDMIQDLFICLLCGGHALIEGVPGLGKTLMVKSLSEVLHLDFSRIQFTPDLMPADILGTNIVNEDPSGRRFFEFFRGPIFGQIILADEINRATPKTQSALLEAMQEQKITIFGKVHSLESPFMVLATQNPLEMEGTYPLPEAQVDRFFYKILLSYPSVDELSTIVDKTTEGDLPPLGRVLDAEQIQTMKRTIKQVPLAYHVKKYAIHLILATHPDKEQSTDESKMYVRYGSSPRGLQNLVMAAKVRALLEGRFNVSQEDIRAVAKPALRHRILLNLRGETEGVSPDGIIDTILKTLPELRA